MYILSMLVILFLIIDFLFYIPIKIHILVSDEIFGIFIFNIRLIYISKDKVINRLKNALSIEALKNVDPEDLNYIETVHLNSLYININTENMEEHHKFQYIMALESVIPIIDYFLKGEQNFNVSYDDKNKKYNFYSLIDIKLAKIVRETIIIRRLKNEKTSAKRFNRKFN